MSDSFDGPAEVGDGNYVGLRLVMGGGDYHYGWVAFAPRVDGVYTITGFAFNSTLNEGIVAGAGMIPEPTTAAMLLLGGTAFAFSRRRRLEGSISAA